VQVIHASGCCAVRHGFIFSIASAKLVEEVLYGQLLRATLVERIQNPRITERLKKEHTMPIDPRKRQKQQERRAAKRHAKQQEVAKEKHLTLAEHLTAATRFPILHSWATADLWTEGLGWVCLSRQLPNSLVAYAVFLVDRYCLGVKNAIAGVRGRFTYDSEIVSKMRSDFTSKELHPAAVRKLVESAVQYARSLGLQPHPDYHKAKLIFGDIDAGQCTEEFEFGKDGKPFFVAGPRDNPERCRQILKALDQSCGQGGFDFLIPLTDPSKIFP
jgi:hypothetical protein